LRIWSNWLRFERRRLPSQPIGVLGRGALAAQTPSALSKLVARLERRLGVRLVNRSTRKLQLTPEGAAFFELCVKVLADIGEAERGAATSAATVLGRAAARPQPRRPGAPSRSRAEFLNFPQHRMQ
jgi:DNA-binding transcriptional LysR family regulator